MIVTCLECGADMWQPAPEIYHCSKCSFQAEQITLDSIRKAKLEELDIAGKPCLTCEIRKKGLSRQYKISTQTYKYCLNECPTGKELRGIGKELGRLELSSRKGEAI